MITVELSNSTYEIVYIVRDDYDDTPENVEYPVVRVKFGVRNIEWIRDTEAEWEEIELPWEYRFLAEKSQKLYLWATSEAILYEVGDLGWIHKEYLTCIITANGVIIAEKTGNGAVCLAQLGHADELESTGEIPKSDE